MIQAGRRAVGSVILLFSMVALGVSPTSPIVMRHDVEEASFLELGSRYPATANLKRPGRVGDTGTLIGPRWVLTAAHVANGLRPDDLAVFGETEYRIERVIKHPEWTGDADMKVDIALCYLASAVTDVEPVHVYRDADEDGMVVTFAGRGGDGTGLTGPANEDGRLRGATNKVEKVEESYVRFRFDEPGDPDITDLEGISGPGDSGGPAYIEKDGTLYVIGVSSGQSTRGSGGKEGHYKVHEYYTRVSHFAEWIDTVMFPGESGS